MSDVTLVPGASKTKKTAGQTARETEMEAAARLVRQAREQGLGLTGPNGLGKQLTKAVIETALNEEMTEHLGREKHEKTREGRAWNTRNGTTKKTVLTDAVGEVEVEVPRDRDSSAGDC